jgi:hypothetical protein
MKAKQFSYTEEQWQEIERHLLPWVRLGISLEDYVVGWNSILDAKRYQEAKRYRWFLDPDGDMDEDYILDTKTGRIFHGALDALLDKETDRIFNGGRSEFVEGHRVLILKAVRGYIGAKRTGQKAKVNRNRFYERVETGRKQAKDWLRWLNRELADGMIGLDNQVISRKYRDQTEAIFKYLSDRKTEALKVKRGRPTETWKDPALRGLISKLILVLRSENPQKEPSFLFPHRENRHLSAYFEACVEPPRTYLRTELKMDPEDLPFISPGNLRQMACRIRRAWLERERRFFDSMRSEAEYKAFETDEE